MQKLHLPKTHICWGYYQLINHPQIELPITNIHLTAMSPQKFISINKINYNIIAIVVNKNRMSKKSTKSSTPKINIHSIIKAMFRHWWKIVLQRLPTTIPTFSTFFSKFILQWNLFHYLMPCIKNKIQWIHIRVYCT